MKVNSLMVLNKEEENWYFQMELSMKVILEWENFMERVNWVIQKWNIKDSGEMGWKMGLGNITLKVAPYIQETIKTILKMVKEFISFMTERRYKEYGFWEN